MNWKVFYFFTVDVIFFLKSGVCVIYSKRNVLRKTCTGQFAMKELFNFFFFDSNGIYAFGSSFPFFILDAKINIFKRTFTNWYFWQKKKSAANSLFLFQMFQIIYWQLLSYFPHSTIIFFFIFDSRNTKTTSKTVLFKYNFLVTSVLFFTFTVKAFKGI